MKPVRLAKILLGLGLSIILFSPSFLANLTLEETVRLGDFPRSANFRNDYELLLWLHNNVAINDVILNECTFTSFYLRGFSMKNVTCGIQMSQNMIGYLVQLVRPFWDEPSESLLIKIIQTYHVKYIFLDSEPMYWTLYNNWKPGVGSSTPYEYRNKPHDPGYYRSFFQRLSYVKVVVSKGEAAIYKVTS